MAKIIVSYVKPEIKEKITKLLFNKNVFYFHDKGK